MLRAPGSQVLPVTGPSTWIEVLHNLFGQLQCNLHGNAFPSFSQHEASLLLRVPLHSATSGITRISLFVEIDIIKACRGAEKDIRPRFGFDSGKNAVTGMPK